MVKFFTRKKLKANLKAGKEDTWRSHFQQKSAHQKGTVKPRWLEQREHDNIDTTSHGKVLRHWCG